MSVIVNTRTGERGEYADFVKAFAARWREGRSSLDNFMDLLGPDIELSAPGLRPTRGHAAAREAFRRTFEVLPDLTARVNDWGANGDALFIEMTFSATIGGRPVTWENVDRFCFRGGMAVRRVAYFDQLRLRRAFMRGPRGWMHLARRIRAGL